VRFQGTATNCVGAQDALRRRRGHTKSTPMAYRALYLWDIYVTGIQFQPHAAKQINNKCIKPQRHRDTERARKIRAGRREAAFARAGKRMDE